MTGKISAMQIRKLTCEITVARKRSPVKPAPFSRPCRGRTTTRQVSVTTAESPWLHAPWSATGGRNQPKWSHVDHRIEPKMFTGREFEHIEHLIIHQLLTYPLVSRLHCNMLNMLNVLTRFPVSIFPWRASFFLSRGLFGSKLVAKALSARFERRWFNGLAGSGHRFCSSVMCEIVTACDF
jgi:hypothetical protein